MKNIFFSALALFFCVTPLTANNPSWSASVEFLYMFPSMDQPYFVIDSISSEPNGERFSNNQPLHPGYRAELAYLFCNQVNDVRLRWTHFPTFCDEKTKSGNELFPVMFHPINPSGGVNGTISIEDCFDFYFLDLVFSQRALCCGPFLFDLVGGLRWGYLDLREQVVLQSTGMTRDVKVHSQFWGVGPDIGFDFEYNLCYGLALHGKADVALLVSRREASYSDSESFVYAKNEPYCAVVPTSDIRLGINYNKELNFRCLAALPTGCGWLNFEIGYEIITFYKGLDRIYFVDDGSLGASFDELMDFTLQGPYFHLGFTF